MRGTYGRTLRDSFAFYDPESSSLRTSQATFDLGFTPSLPTLPDWGWMSGGELYEHLMSVPHISEQGSSSLLASPTAGMEGRKSEQARLSRSEGGQGSPPGLREQVKALLPTVTATERPQRTMHTKGNLTLQGAVGEANPADVERVRQYRERMLLPTPTSQAARHGETEDVTAHGHGSNLWDVPHLLPTPTSGDSHSTRNRTGDEQGWERGQRHAGTTLTDATSPGESMRQPSASGSTSADDPLLGQLMIGDA